MTEELKKDNEEIFPFLQGERIDLVAQNSKWIPLYCKWQNTPEVRHYARMVMPSTPEDLKSWFEPPAGRGTREGVSFTIYHKEDRCPIGSMGLFRINWVNRNAFIMGIIGEPEYWGKGIIGEAAELLINYGFTELNLHKIYAGVFDPNKRSLRAAEKLGFKQEAHFKEDLFVDGVYVDMHQFALFKKD
ncbi:MAG: GNAT family N-acetyltransferase [Promethearchaeota archaeon]|nr:MAG: GNAT family N-acetyltransferase [Candidatus Lokiarchaeota archaeon]